MRLHYVDPAVIESAATGNAAAIIERVRQRRHPRPLQPLDLALLHSPPFADGWNSFIGAVRSSLTLTDDIREIAICRVAITNGAWYEWGHHAPLAAAGGLTEGGMRTLALEQLPRDAAQIGLTEKQLAVARYTDAMTAQVTVPDDLFAKLKSFFSD